MEHPPGKDTLAFLSLATRGPKTRIDALIFLTRSYGASVLQRPPASIRTLLPSSSILAPRPASKSFRSAYLHFALKGMSSLYDNFIHLFPKKKRLPAFNNEISAFII
jgi:hypothetical protein